jgi:hypothetical protein
MKIETIGWKYLVFGFWVLGAKRNASSADWTLSNLELLG